MNQRKFHQLTLTFVSHYIMNESSYYIVSFVLPHLLDFSCFTLMSLASSAANVKLIRCNEMSRLSLELALQKHPDEVGINILTLLRRLKFDDS